VKLAVIGDPVEHSRSPELLANFMASEGLAGSYERIRVPAGTAAAAIEQLRALGYLGLNVTTPLKEEAFAYAATHDAIALATGSVNTLVLEGRTAGYNTDGVGTMGVLADAGLHDVAAARVLIVGAGPTARSAVAALRGAGSSVWIWNRSPERAVDVARAFDARVHEGGNSYDAVFAALPPGAEPQDAGVVRALLETPIFVDANYGARATLAAALGRRGFDGARMLEHSARASFDIWRTVLQSKTSPQ
jgi:shikimate dehydrogenase